MKKIRVVVSICIIISFLTACAPRPHEVAATYVSPLQYQGYSCSQIRQELMRVNQKTIEVTKSQDHAADKDAAGLIVGALIFWPALFLMIGGDRKDELAKLKGEFQALELAAIQKECDVATELRKAKEQRDEYEKKRNDLIKQTGVGAGETPEE